MDHDLKIAEVPRRRFEKAMSRFGHAFGKGFSGFVDRLNRDAVFVRTLVEFIKYPQAAFVRMLLQYLGTTMPLEQVQESISMQCSAETDKLFDRAIYWARRAHPSLGEPLGLTRWEFVPYVIGLIQDNRVTGIVAIQYLTFELGLRQLILTTLNKTESPFNWSLLEGHPDNEEKSRRIRAFFNKTNFYWRLSCEHDLSKLQASPDQFVEATWTILKYDSHKRQRVKPA